MPSFVPILFLTIVTGGFQPGSLRPPDSPTSPLWQECPSVQEGPSVVVPHGEPIMLDGVLDPDEWTAASRHTFSGGEVLLQYQGDLVSVGVRGSRAGFPHVALSVGDSIWVLHASAALGKVVYGRDGQGWTLVTPPIWEVRDPSLTPAASEARENYLQANDWVGTTGRMGNPGETEFLIRIGKFGGDDIRFAVAHLAPVSSEGTTRWPETNQDDIGTLQLLTGPMPEGLEFTPNQWALLLVSIGERAPSPPEGRWPH